jgi:hypothetical protein
MARGSNSLSSTDPLLPIHYTPPVSGPDEEAASFLTVFSPLSNRLFILQVP